MRGIDPRTFVGFNDVLFARKIVIVVGLGVAARACRSLLREILPHERAGAVILAFAVRSRRCDAV
ncbi:hypothetical protein [Burkholderia pyrrocinia]|uniref:hypothetical protein n=1 Tax=Burkholderia pyrrocinia TaxID=60550 RepID=UPI00064B842F|nr:hypothetical protein [Burkholderia pyrrocinia]AKM04780.1 hypothetical protein ABD05_31500 [Burkholderia pyrrocinia]